MTQEEGNLEGSSGGKKKNNNNLGLAVLHAFVDAQQEWNRRASPRAKYLPGLFKAPQLVCRGEDGFESGTDI